MRFSLKDMLWSVTFASLGIGALASSSKLMPLNPNQPLGFAVLVSLGCLFLPGLFFGAAIGRLKQKAMTGALVGFVLWTFLMLIVTTLARAAIH